jgi:hypothetical protein
MRNGYILCSNLRRGVTWCDPFRSHLTFPDHLGEVRTFEEDTGNSSHEENYDYRRRHYGHDGSSTSFCSGQQRHGNGKLKRNSYCANHDR